jgi:outer membrane receptor protein involved in Fe transport
MVGYDKMLSKDFYHGKAYAGFYFGKLDASTSIETGGGKQDAKTIGVYSVWAGDRGHYLDLGLQASKFKSDLSFTDSNGPVEGKYSTWGYTLGAQYGFKNRLSKGWFVEPQAALFYGQSNGVDYELSNHLRLSEEESKSLTGRLGIKAGKEVSEYGNLYLSAAVLRDFKDRAGLTMSYGTQSQSLELPGGKDTWYELGIGGNIRTSSNSNLRLDFARTFGGNLGNEWRVNALLEVTWGGQPAAMKEGTDYSVFNYAKQLTDNGAMDRRAEFAMTGEEAGGLAGNAAAAAQSGEAQTDGETNTAAEPAGTDADLPAEAQAEGDGYALPGLTVEADRPAWERDLSPGAVSVVYPEEYKGEQKSLPDLLERVPGLFIQRVSGAGHYAVARVRASTAAQVHVYVDGVLMNLNGEAAVNLSTIPAENVERVEVYRGYVPARFSGSPLGGVINIVTKKPSKPGWYISEGFRSYGGYRGSYEYTTPLGKGTLLLGYNRDIWTGDFPIRARLHNPYNAVYNLDAAGNDYQNSDALVKWQDDNWTVKFAWKKNFEHLPYSLGGNSHWYDYQLVTYGTGERNKWLENQQTEFQVGRRDTTGNLDWGWRLNYLNAKKRYRWPYAMNNNPPWLTTMPGDSWSDYDSKKWGANLNAALKMGENHLVELNFDYSHETLDADGSDWDTWNSSPYAQTTQRIYIHEFKIKEYHLTLQDTFKLNSSGDFKLTPVVRADKVEMSTMSMNDQRWIYSGGIGLRKDLGDAWTLKTTWGTYNRHPNFYEIFGDGGSIRANHAFAAKWGLAGPGTWETGTQFDFGVNWRGKAAGAKSDISLTWFQRDSKNELVLTVPPVEGATASYQALGKNKVHGLEMGANFNWKRVNFALNATWTQSGRFGNYGQRMLIPYLPEWVVSARADYTLPGDRLNLFAEYYYTGKQYPQSVNSYLEALGMVNVGAKYSFGKGFKLTAGVNDIFNKGHEQLLKYYTMGQAYDQEPLFPLPGRMYYVTLEYKF